jgi:hypothetical protein
MIKYIKKLNKKQKLLKKYERKMENCLESLSRFKNINGSLYKHIEKDLMLFCRCYNRLKKL